MKSLPTNLRDWSENIQDRASWLSEQTLKILKTWFFAVVLGGSLALSGSVTFIWWSDVQTSFYDRGVQLYINGNMEKAVEMFDRSAQYYRRGTTEPWYISIFYPGPSRELAALANHHKARALAIIGQVEPAVESFKEALRLNPGINYERIEDFALISRTDRTRLLLQSLDMKRNFELLLKKNQDQQQKQGKGKGKPKEGGKPQPGNQPGSKSGKGNRNAL